MRQQKSSFGRIQAAPRNAMSNEFRQLLDRPLGQRSKGPVLSNGFYSLLYGGQHVPKFKREMKQQKKLWRLLLRRLPVINTIETAIQMFGPGSQIATPPGYYVVCDVGIAGTHGPKNSGNSPICGLDLQSLNFTPPTVWTALGYVHLRQTRFVPPYRGMVVKQWARLPGAHDSPVMRSPVAWGPAAPQFPDPLPPPMTMQPPARQVPWSLLPETEPGPEGAGAGAEGPLTSNGGTATAPAPVETPDLVVTLRPDAPPIFEDRPPTHKFERPGRGVKERKMKIALAGVAQRLVGMMTEGLDWVAAIHKSLPKECRAKARWRNGKWVNSSPQDKIAAIYEHWDCIDVADLIYQVGYMQVTDAAWGKLGQAAGKAAAHVHKTGYGSPAVGFQFGEWDTFSFDTIQTAIEDMPRPKSAPRPRNVAGKPKCKGC